MHSHLPDINATQIPYTSHLAVRDNHEGRAHSEFHFILVLPKLEVILNSLKGKHSFSDL